MIWRAIAIWLVLMILAIVNGGVRDAVVTPRTGEHAGHVIATVVLSAIILLVARGAIGWIRPGDRRGALAVGATWLGLTLAFEFLAGHYLFRASWQRLVADYDVSRGRIWPLVLLTTLVAPLIVYRLRGVTR